MAIEQPQPLPLFCDHHPVIAHAAAPVGIVQPPFGRDAFRAADGNDPVAAPAPAKRGRQAGRVGGTTAVFAADNTAMYFSKEVVPFTSDSYASTDPTPVFHHVGVYAYRPDALAAYPNWPTGPLEQLEGLEQLRFMENSRKVLCVEVEAKGRQFWELNNPQDVPKIEAMMADMGLE